jgi:type IV pilus assembly protein PilM
MDTPIDKIKNFLSSFTKKSGGSKSVIGLDIGSSSIKIVQLSLVGNTITMDTYGAIALGPYDNKLVGEDATLSPEKTLAALVELLKDCGSTASDIAVAIPTNSAFFKEIEVPEAITNEEMPTVIMSLARQVIPLPIQDVVIDSFVLPQDIRAKEAIKQDKKEIMLVAVTKESIKSKEDLIKSANLKVDFSEIESFSTVRSIYAHEKSPLVILDLGSRFTKVYIVHEGVLAFVSRIEYGGSVLTQSLMNAGNISFKEARLLKHRISLSGIKDEEVFMRSHFENIMKPLESIINQYEKTSSQAIDRIVLCGGGAEFINIKQYTEERLQIPVDICNPFLRIAIPHSIHQSLIPIAPEFTIASGLALRALTSA